MSISKKYIGLDVSKSKIAVAIAEEGREEARYWGTIPHTKEQVVKLMHRLRNTEEVALEVCYEAGPTGYVLYRADDGAMIAARSGGKRKPLFGPGFAPPPADQPFRKDQIGNPAQPGVKTVRAVKVVQQRIELREVFERDGQHPQRGDPEPQRYARKRQRIASQHPFPMLLDPLLADSSVPEIGGGQPQNVQRQKSRLAHPSSERLKGQVDAGSSAYPDRHDIQLAQPAMQRQTFRLKPRAEQERPDGQRDRRSDGMKIHEVDPLPVRKIRVQQMQLHQPGAFWAEHDILHDRIRGNEQSQRKRDAHPCFSHRFSFRFFHL